VTDGFAHPTGPQRKERKVAATDQTKVRNVVGKHPKTLEEIVRVTKLDPARARVAVEKLVARGRLRRRVDGYTKP